MAERQPISAFGLQASSSAKKCQATATQRRPNSTSKAVHGILRFKQPAATTPNSVTGPITIDNDDDENVEPVYETAGSWGQEVYSLREYEPSGSYDETFKPPERDSQDETMPTVFRKTRQQPARHAVSKRGLEAFQVEVNGQYTPPATNSRQIRGDRAHTTHAKRQREVDTSHSSDPVETPVAGPSRLRLSSKTPLTARRTASAADPTRMSTKSSQCRMASAPGLIVPSSAKDGEGDAVRQKNWLSKRSGNESTSSRNNGIQTKLTAFVKDKTSGSECRTGDQERNRVDFDLPALAEMIDHPQDEEEFDQSVRFVSMQNKAVGGPFWTSAQDALGPPVPNSKLSRAIVSARPQPRRKKRKSDEVTDEESETTIDPPAATVAANPSDALLSRLYSHKRFKKQQERRAQGFEDSTSRDADETSSLTSLSKNPSSEAEDEEANVNGAVRLVRGRPGRAMKVVCSSDAEELAQDERLAYAAEKQRQRLQSVSSTVSSVVPDSQPWHVLSASLLERAHFDSEPFTDDCVQPETSKRVGSHLQDVISTDRKALEIDDGPDENMDRYTDTQPGEETEPSTHFPVRVIGREARPFPFPPQGPDIDHESKVPLGRGQSSITISSLRPHEPSQGTTAIPNLAAKARQAVPSLTEDDLETAAIHASRADPLSQQAGDMQQVGSSQESESLDFFRHMRKILPPPTGQTSRPAWSVTVESRPIERDDLFSQSQHFREPMLVAHLKLDKTSTDTKESESLFEERREPSKRVALSPARNISLHGGVDAAAAFEETMLPLTLDTQLHRPGILSPNFQLRRRKPNNNTAAAQLKSAGVQVEPSTPRNMQDIALPQPVGSHQQVASSVTPSRSDIHKSLHRSPESMVENVQTLATWSPLKPDTFKPPAIDCSVNLRALKQDKENLFALEGGMPSQDKRLTVSSDEFVEGTFGPIESLHLLETYHRGYTPRKDSAVEEREKAMPRIPLQSRCAPATRAFPEVDRAWKGAQNGDKTPKSANSQRAIHSKEEAKAQSKLASYGFLKNENVKKVRPVSFHKEFEDEDDLQEDEETDIQKTFDRRSLSPTPRKAVTAGKVMSAVPPPPIDPRMRPAGIKELQRRKAGAASKSEASLKSPQPRNSAQSDGVAAKHANAALEDIVPSSQPSEEPARHTQQ